jgi:hypothetical protein
MTGDVDSQLALRGNPGFYQSTKGKLRRTPPNMGRDLSQMNLSLRNPAIAVVRFMKLA